MAGPGPGNRAQQGIVRADLFQDWDFKSNNAHPVNKDHLICVSSEFGNLYIDLNQSYHYTTAVEAVTLMKVVNALMEKVDDSNQTRTAFRKAKMRTLTERAWALQEKPIPEGFKMVVYMCSQALDNIIKTAQQFREVNATRVTLEC